jgi:dynein heavy chain
MLSLAAQRDLTEMCPAAQLLSEVFLPVLMQEAGLDSVAGQDLGSVPSTASIGHAAGSSGSRSSSSSRELLLNMQKFLGQVGQTLQQLNGDITFPLPDITVDDPEQAANDAELINILEQHIAEWSAMLAAALQAESKKQPTGRGPLAEVEFWRNRNAILSSLHEQLNLPHVARMVQAAELGSDDRNLLSAFKSQVSCSRTATGVEVKSTTCSTHWCRTGAAGCVLLVA